jgi:cell division septal protein FtsQ
MSSGQERRAPPAAGVAAPADPRFRRAEGPIVRRRRGRVLLRRVVRFMVPAAVVAGLTVAAAQAVIGSGLLRVREVAVTGNRRLSAEEVRTLVAGLEREQIFRLDLEHYRARLLDSPWIADVTLTRVLPATIQIAVVERTPIAAARHGQQLYLVDKTGSIIGDYGPAYRDLDLPLVTGLFAEARGADPTVVDARVALAASFFEGFHARLDLLARLSEIDVTNAHDAIVLLDDDTAWLHLGDRDFAERLQRYVEARSALAERFGQLDYVDLRFEERMFVRGLDRGRRLTHVGRSGSE